MPVQPGRHHALSKHLRASLTSTTDSFMGGLSCMQLKFIAHSCFCFFIILHSAGCLANPRTAKTVIHVLTVLAAVAFAYWLSLGITITYEPPSSRSTASHSQTKFVNDVGMHGSSQESGSSWWKILFG